MFSRLKQSIVAISLAFVTACASAQVKGPDAALDNAPPPDPENKCYGEKQEALDVYKYPGSEYLVGPRTFPEHKKNICTEKKGEQDLGGMSEEPAEDWNGQSIHEPHAE